MLPEQRRSQLDGIVQQMIANNEPDSNIRFVVNDFKEKYSVKNDFQKQIQSTYLPLQTKSFKDNIPTNVTNLLTPSQSSDMATTGVTNIKSGLAQAATWNTKNPLSSTIGLARAAKGVAEVATAPFAPIVNPISVPYSAVINKTGDAIASIPSVKKYLASIPEGGLQEQFVEGLSDAGVAANTALGAKTVIPTINAAATVLPRAAKNAANKLSTVIPKQSQQAIQSSIIAKYDKGVKPLINAKRTPAQLEKYRTDVISGIQTIKENKLNLKYEAPDGTVITEQTPRTLQQFSDAIEQTKRSVFTQYDQLAKTAGDAGVKVDLTPIAAELDVVKANKALKLTNPAAIEYASDLQKRYLAEGQLDAVTAQDVIQNYNKSLEAFYRNPSYETATKASIDAMVVNNVRKALDEGITNLTGEQYASLKKQYGSLKSIESDVLKATLRDARKNTKGLIDFTDVFSGGQVVNGILSLNPSTVATGIASKAIAEFYKYLNNPNRAIEAIFKDAEKLQRDATQSSSSRQSKEFDRRVGKFK